MDNNLIINKLSVKHKLSPELIDLCINHTFNEIKNSISDINIPNVMISNWGRFYPKLSEIEHKIIQGLNHYNFMLPDYKYETIINLLNAYERICKEENKKPKYHLLIIKEKLLDGEFRRYKES